MLLLRGTMTSDCEESPNRHKMNWDSCISQGLAYHCLYSLLRPVDYAAKMQRPSSWLRAHAVFAWVCFEITAAMSIMVVLVSWTLETPPNVKEATSFLNINEHVLNCVVTYIVFFLSRIQVAMSHALFYLAVAVVYAAMQWSTHAWLNTTWAYDFLDTADPYAIAWYLGLMAAHVLFFSLGYAAMRLRDRGYVRRQYDAINNPLSIDA